MDEALIPDWITKIKQQDETDRHKEELGRQRDIRVQEIIGTGGRAFWKQLCEALRDICLACSSVEVRADCSQPDQEPTNVQSALSQLEQSVAVNMAFGDPTLRTARVDIGYTFGTSYLRVYKRGKPEERLELSVDSKDEVCVISDSNRLNPEQTARAIAEPMVHYVRGESARF
jgi:hypothetical protein